MVPHFFYQPCQRTTVDYSYGCDCGDGIDREEAILELDMTGIRAIRSLLRDAHCGRE